MLAVEFEYILYVIIIFDDMAKTKKSEKNYHASKVEASARVKFLGSKIKASMIYCERESIRALNKF